MQFLEVVEIDAELTKRASLIKATIAVVLGTYLAILAFVFGFLLWQTITVHLEDSTAQTAILVALALMATAWGGYVASWFNYYRNSRLLGLLVGISLYLVSVLLLTIAPGYFSSVLPFAQGESALAGLQGIVPPLIAGALGGWIAEHRNKLY